jgi:cytochrome c-type biogenesis protein CcmF
MGLHDKLQIGRYTLVYQEYSQDDTPNYFVEAALLDVYEGNKYLGQLTPALKRYKPMDQPDHIVANRSTLREDLYVIYEGSNEANGHPTIKAFVNPLVAWFWIGIWVLIFGTGMALVPNAAPVRSPVSVAEAVPAREMQPAGAGK